MEEIFCFTMKNFDKNKLFIREKYITEMIKNGCFMQCMPNVLQCMPTEKKLVAKVNLK